MPFPKVGNVAPAFSLKNQRGETIKLTDFKGNKNVVLYFYPKAMTPGCTVQACGIRDTKDEFAQLDTVVLGISPDPYPRLARFEEKQQLNFDLLSDEDHAVTQAYGCWDMKKFMGREFMGVLRTSFVIDKQGKIRLVMDKVKTKTHHDDILRWVKENLV
ncbi:thioredoxin-dependent thiol peroxidase [Porticoccus sp.]|uniref:thioredoxin-dependent thiol peroxidase n=1 Tax=Porticoccus sp. TaxID=2024853 RepID=UPI000C4514C1|nr:thioredoxin-dependent thiol peroxidase [Porticoccus sp.]MAZ69931.1 thioredoxin-dependent thiol peroxidase [Porticoccus sp.]|tara:strand:+ start:6580 stop:7056 length:477 start_codon:yes stop_codon:yes gene_type:complete